MTRLFDTFTQGETIGAADVVLDAAMADAWAIVSGRPAPAPGTPCPAGLLVAAMMRGYTRVCDNRPPGNVHAGQQLTFGPRPLIGDKLTLVLACATKELRNGRRWLGFDVTMTGRGDVAHLAGRMRLLWAA